MKSVEKIGKTVDDAITDALIELGAATDEVDVEVLEKGSKGFLGFGAKEAKVRVTLKEISYTQEDMTKEKTPLLTVPEVKVEPKKEVKVEAQQVAPKVETKAPANYQEAIALAEGFLTKILKEMELEASLETEVVNERICINISGPKMGVVIGKRGDTLDALQYLTNIVVNKGNDQYVKIMLDTENYRARREETLKKVAFKMAKKASQTRRPVTLEPMNPYDRRIIHSALQESRYVKTHSEGKEPFRRVVITPISYKTYNK